jgi:membrane protease YdiL (CAAX protease family)
MEELIFRKWLVDRLSPLGGTTTILISGLFFGLFHGNLDQFFYAALIGAFLAYIYLNTGKIWHTMLIHAVLNFFGGVLPTIFTASIPDFYTIMNSGDVAAMEELIMQYPLQYMGYLVTGLLPLFFGIAGLVVFCLYFKRLFRWIAPCTIPKEERVKTIVLNFGFIAFAIVSLIEMVIVIVENVMQTTGGV